MLGFAWVNGHHQCCRLCLMPYRQFRATVVAMAKPWRPDMDDVDRLSKGDGAKRRGTGNYNIPHRLNSDERPVYEAAKKKGYLQVRGTGYRKGRKGNPINNIYRQWCDSKGTACIVIEQDTTGSSQDVVVVDLSPLRRTDLSAVVQLCNSLAAKAGARRMLSDERPFDAVPFNTIPVTLPVSVQQMLDIEAAAAAAPAPPTPEQLRASEMAVLQQADLVRQLKASGLGNATPEVQRQVQDLLKLKADLQQLLDAAAGQETKQHECSSSTGSSDSNSSSAGLEEHQQQHHMQDASAPTDIDIHSQPSRSNSSSTGAGRKQQMLPEDHPFANAAIWQLPVLPLFYQADRTTAKDLARNLSSTLAAATASR